tara:strand:- start:154 stop:468 length:315 start_codon:yes stop_codon:yes gene_type:complete
MNFNSAQNATPDQRDSLARMLNLFQQNNPNNPFLQAISGSQPNGLPTGTQRYDPKGTDALYTMKLVGSSLLGYPQEGVFNAPNPRSQEDIKASLEQKRVKGLLG